jgi:signal transduction histidine kinase
MKLRGRRSGLFVKYFAFIGLLVSVGLIASGAIGLYFSYQETRSAIASLQRESALTAAVRIEHFLRDIESQLGWTTLPLVAPVKSDMDNRRLDYLKVLRQLPAVTEVSYLDGRGHEQLKVSRLAMDTAGSDVDFSADPRFVEARKGKTWFGPVYFRKETEPYMAISIPEARDRPGVTVVEVNLKFIWDVVSRIRIGQKGIAFVVDREGFLVAHPDISLVLKKVNLSQLAHVREALSAPLDAIRTEAFEDVNLDGVRVLSSYAPVEPTGWRVFVEEPTSAVFANLRDAILRTVLLLFAGVLISIVASVFLARRMVQPVRALQLGAERIGAGDLSKKIEVRTGDELEDLANRFNTMTQQLRESYADLERKVEERTAELSEALEQQTATANVLKVISSSPTDVRPVFDAIVKSARELGEARNAYAFTYDGERIGYVSGTDRSPEWTEYMRTRPAWTPSCRTMTGRVVLARATVQIEDMYADPEYDKGPLGSERRLLGVPMLREGVPIGVLTVSWDEPGAVPPKFVRVLETFAAQAVIAVENVRLFNELQARNRDLGESLQQQTATAEVLRVISSSPTDVMPVFQAIVQSARELGEANSASAFRFDGQGVHFVTSTNESPEWLQLMRDMGVWQPDRTTMSGRVMLSKSVETIDDMSTDPEYASCSVAISGEHRLLGIPMLRDGEPIGALTVAWREPGKVPEKFVRLLQTFADQAVIAVENVRLFNEIQDKSRQLEAANKHKSEFLANMSHELRTPLNAIIGFSEVMLTGMTGALPGKQKEFIGDIRDSGKHLLALINDILDLSKIEAGRMELDVARFDLREAMANAMTLVRGRAERHGIRLESDVAPEVAGYDGDERKFKQIVLNLLTNAVKFTPEGGTVTLGATRANGAYVFSVRDTGVGIAPGDQQLIFEEFRQVGSDYERKAEGTGLGLALTRRLVQLHGGEISVDSAPGRGSTFTFTLPIATP